MITMIGVSEPNLVQIYYTSTILAHTPTWILLSSVHQPNSTGHYARSPYMGNHKHTGIITTSNDS